MFNSALNNMLNGINYDYDAFYLKGSGEVYHKVSYSLAAIKGIK